MSEKSVHIEEELHRILKMISAEKEATIKEITNDLIAEALEYRKGEFQDYISTKIEDYNSIELKNDRIELQGLDASIVEEAEEHIEESSIGSEEKKREDTLRCIRYLQSVGEARKRDFIEHCYDEGGSEESFWRRASEGMHELSDHIDELETPSKGHSVYRWEN